jgi:hypothetical protein
MSQQRASQFGNCFILGQRNLLAELCRGESKTYDNNLCWSWQSRISDQHHPWCNGRVRNSWRQLPLCCAHLHFFFWIPWCPSFIFVQCKFFYMYFHLKSALFHKTVKSALLAKIAVAPKLELGQETTNHVSMIGPLRLAVKLNLTTEPSGCEPNKHFSTVKYAHRH